MGGTATFNISKLGWVIKVFFVSCSISDIIIFPIIFPPIGVLEMGQRSVRAFGGFTFGIGTISEILNASGNMPDIKAQLVILQKGKASSAANSAIICLGKSSGRKDFLEYFFER